MTRPRASDDRELCARLAKRALTRPNDYGTSDEREFVTHGCVASWADRSDDILAESNYHAALAMLAGAVAHDETGASEARGDDVLDNGASHWGWGHVRQLFVRVYLPGCEPWEVDYDQNRVRYTPAWLEAVDIHAALESYPVLDDSDYSEREHEAWESAVNDALDQAARGYPNDTDAECQAFYTLITCHEPYRDELTSEGFSPDSVSWADVADLYRTVRDDHFEWLAQWHMAPYVWPEPADQWALFNAP